MAVPIDMARTISTMAEMLPRSAGARGAPRDDSPDAGIAYAGEASPKLEVAAAASTSSIPAIAAAP